MKSTRHARLRRAAIILILVTAAGAFVAAPAQAAAYRYWGFFHQDKGAWAFAQKGPAQTIPADGTVDGWRFAVADESSVRTPRALPTFATLCAGTAAKAGTKRVGLLIDFGRPADSADGTTGPGPKAACVAVPPKATSSDILVAAGTTLRIDKSLTCGINGWPKTGCGDPVAPVPAAAAVPDTAINISAPVAKAAASPAAQSSDDGSNTTRWLALSGVVALVGVLGFAAWRRGRDATDN